MAFVKTNSTVGTAATQIVGVPHGSRQNIPVYIQNNDTAAIFIGTSNVTTSGATQGWKIAAGANLQLWLNGGDTVYAISAAGTAANSVIVTYSA